MFDKMKQLMEMKKQADRLKRELDSMTVESSSVNGIKVVVNGSQQFRSITIDQELIRPENKSRLEVDVLRSINTAVQKSQQMAAQKMREVMPNMPNF